MKLLKEAYKTGWKLVFYRGILKDAAVTQFMQLLDAIVAYRQDKTLPLKAYYDFAAVFLEEAAGVLSRNCCCSWRYYLAKLVAEDENVFTRHAESAAFDWHDSSGTIKLAGQDLVQLQALASISAAKIKEALSLLGINKKEIDSLPDWDCLNSRDVQDGGPDLSEEAKDIQKEANNERFRFIRAFADSADWEEVLPSLIQFYRDNGVGMFGKYRAFRWERQNDRGCLVGVEAPDTLHMRQLYEYEREQKKIIENTEQFLAGYPANNILLYGDRGTGKSSTVKALLNEYGHRGLRLVEMQKQDLADFNRVIALLAGRSQKFIIFVDDLSFNEQEGDYRELKALLEGGLEAKPANIILYATSNRRHLVQESFSDRDASSLPGTDDVRPMDTLEEKLSLADRFGITVTFASPDQKRYLAIVEKIVRERGLAIDKNELEERALKWELSFNARSGRTARQFVDYLEGALGLDEGCKHCPRR